MNRNWFILILVMVLLAVTVNLVSYDKTTTLKQGVDIVRQVPLQLGDWKGMDAYIDPIVFNILETKAILHRNYRNSKGLEVFLSLVYYEETKVDFHAPEGCLGGQGIKTEKSDATVNIRIGTGETVPLDVNKLIQKQNDGSRTLVYYFYKTGAFVGRDYIKMRLNLILNKFTKSKKSGSLIRVSTPLVNVDNEKAAKDQLEEFTSTLYPYLVQYL